MLILVLVASWLILVKPTKAEPKKIVVPDDYPTISAAIGNATDGDTILVRKGTYEEQSLTINKTLSLIGEDANKTIINLHPPHNETWLFATAYITYSDAISLSGNDAVLSNFTLVIAPPGGYISAIGNRTQITGNNIVTGPVTGIQVYGSYCNISENVMDARVHVYGFFNKFSKNAFAQIYIQGSSSNIIKDNSCSYIWLNSSTRNIFSGNSMHSIALLFSSNNLFFGNYLESSEYFRFVSSSNNTFTANHWDDYAGSDMDGDGIGDTPYVINAENQDSYPLMAQVNISSVLIEMPEWASPPSVHLVIPENTTYPSANFTLEFTVNKQTSWLGYSLDGQDMITITGNTTLTDLTNGVHNVTVYARDEFDNTGSSETIIFTVDVPEPFPVAPVAAASVASAGVIAVGLLVYFKKRKASSSSSLSDNNTK